MEYVRQSMFKYIEDLSSDSPTPGGGSASAVCGALGVALILMVANFTKGKEAYAAYEDDINGIIKKAEGFRAILLDLVDKDVAVYESLSRAYKIPKEQRGEALENALKQAVDIPLAVSRTAYESLKLTSELLVKGNRNLISDVGVAASMLYSSFESAKLNIDINLRDITDKIFIGRITGEMTGMFGEVKRMAEAVISEVGDKLKLRV